MEFKRLFKWLHRSKKFSWQKPENFDGIETKVDADETRRRLAQASVFPLDDLIFLNQFATPLDRIFLLLGLNCGFGLAEIASLTIEDVCLFQGHSPHDQELLHYETTDEDSFIKRVRVKSGVYGEFLLFEQTVHGLQWALERRRQQSPLDAESQLFLNRQGERYDNLFLGLKVDKSWENIPEDTYSGSLFLEVRDFFERFPALEDRNCYLILVKSIERLRIAMIRRRKDSIHTHELM